MLNGRATRIAGLSALGLACALAAALGAQRAPHPVPAPRAMVSAAVVAREGALDALVLRAALSTPLHPVDELWARNVAPGPTISDARAPLDLRRLGVAEASRAVPEPGGGALLLAAAAVAATLRCACRRAAR